MSILVLALAAWMAGRGEDGGTVDKLALDPVHCVHFTVGGRPLSVSSPYFRGASDEAASLWMLFPGNEGFDPQSNFTEFTTSPAMKNKGPRTKVAIDLFARRYLPTVEEVVAEAAADRRNVEAGIAGTPVGMRHGLEYYKSRSELFFSVYLHREKGRPVVRLRCRETQTRVVDFCYGQFDLDEEVAVHIKFQEEYLPQWRALVEGVRSVVDGTLGGCAADPREVS